MTETIKILTELDNSIEEIKKEYENDDIFSGLVAQGIERARGKIQSKIISLKMEELGLNE